MIIAGSIATWHCLQSFKRPGRAYRYTVKVIDVRKHTARIEAQRYDGTRIRRFVKLDKLSPGALWRD